MSTHVITYEKIVTKRIRVMEQLNLLPCPFCGDAAKFSVTREGDRFEMWGIVCTGCKVRAPMKGGAEAQLKAAAVWNKRTTE